MSQLSLVDGSVMHTVPSPCEYLGDPAISPDGSRIAVGCGYEDVRVYRWPEMEEVTRFDADPVELHFSVDGRWLLAGPYERLRWHDP